MDKKVYIIDGDNFDNLEGFYNEISTILIPGVEWGRNLNAFHDILRGGFGTPEEGFILVWKNSKRSRQLLGYEAIIKLFGYRQPYKRELTPERLKKHYPADKPWSRQQLQEYLNGMDELSHARMREGPTMFDWLVQIIGYHPYIKLRLE